MKYARPRRRLLFSKNLIIMLVLLAVIILSIWSWFSVSKTVTATGITVSSGLPSEIDIAPVIYGTDANGVPVEGPGEFQSSLTFNGPYKLSKDCTGDGMYLYIPEFKSTKDKQEAKADGKIVKDAGQMTNAISQLDSKKEHALHPNQDAPEYQFIEHEFYVRTTDKTYTLKDTSILLSETEANNTRLSATPSAAKKSAYGNFNVDALVGAMRVCFIGQPANNVNQTWVNNHVVTTGTTTPTCSLGTKERQLLWVARPDVYLDCHPNDDTNWSNWTLNTEILPTSSATNSRGDTIKNITRKHEYIKSQSSVLTKVTDDHAIVSSGSLTSIKAMPLGTDVDIAHYSSDNQPTKSSLRKDSEENSSSQDYYVYKITMRIWIEGTDSEARRAMDGGEFRLNLQFGK